jgi:hypothetical protein
MALEEPSINVQKLKAKLQKRYPDYNFDVPAMPDTTCRMKGKCPSSKQVYFDNNGNYFCGEQVEVITDLRSMKKEKRECGAFLVDLSIRKSEEKRRKNDTPLF